MGHLYLASLRQLLSGQVPVYCHWGRGVGHLGRHLPCSIVTGWLFRDLGRLFLIPHTHPTLIVSSLWILTCLLFRPHSSLSTRRRLRTFLASLTEACCWIHLGTISHCIASWTLWYPGLKAVFGVMDQGDSQVPYSSRVREYRKFYGLLKMWRMVCSKTQKHNKGDLNLPHWLLWTSVQPVFWDAEGVVGLASLSSWANFSLVRTGHRKEMFQSLTWGRFSLSWVWWAVLSDSCWSNSGVFLFLFSSGGIFGVAASISLGFWDLWVMGLLNSQWSTQFR